MTTSPPDLSTSDDPISDADTAADEQATAAPRTHKSSPRIDSFAIALPPEWVRIPLGSDFEEFARAQRARMAENGELPKTAQRQLELMLRQLRNDCVRSEVTLAALTMTLVESETGLEVTEFDPESTTKTELLSATCTLSSVSRSGLGTHLPLTANTIAAALSRIRDHADGTEIVNLEPPETLKTPAGSAAKAIRLVTFPPAPITRQRLTLFTQNFFVPYDDGDRAAVISFSSPTITFARPLSALFDAIMLTFRMYGGDDPTDLFPPETQAGSDA